MPPGPTEPLRIGLLAVYFGLFDAAMPPEFRIERTAYAEQIQELLAQHGAVTYPGVVDSDEAGRRAAAAFASSDVEVLVFAPTMAAPPSYAWEAIRDLDTVPVLALAAQEIETIPDDYDTEEATRRSLPVGFAMLTNVLVREERPFVTVVGRVGSEDLDTALEASLRSAAAAAAVRGSRLLSIGGPIDGYLDIEASSAALARIGVDVVDVSASDIGAEFAAVDEAAVVESVTSLRARFDATAMDEETLTRSARLAIAMDQLCSRHGATGGAVNCHGNVLRWNPDVGITACLGVSQCTENGVPFACTGDIPTAVALLLGKRLAGAALYCELYQLDLPGDWVLVANGGEGDPTIRAAKSSVRLLPEHHYAGDRGPGTALAFELPEGPATLISLTPINTTGRWTLVGAEGAIVGSRHRAMEGPNGMFRFSSGAVADGFAGWCAAGATHHAAVLPGHRGEALQQASLLLDIDYAAV